MKDCPKCFAPLEAAGLACTAPHCGRAGIPLPADEVKFDVHKQPICPACESRLTVKVCAECGFSIDAVASTQENIAISLVGSHGSGKSSTLAVMIQQLGSEFGRVYGTTLYPTGGDRTMSHFERHYHHPLFEQGVCVPRTEQIDIDPLTYTLVFPQEAAGKTVGITFYDACGDNFRSEQQMARYNRSLYHSSGILFLVDPRQLSVPKEAAKANSKGKKVSPAMDSDPQALLLRTVHLIRSGLSMDGITKKINIPIAVCLTKLDVMFQHMDKASFLRDPSRHLRRPMMSAADLSSCNLEAQSLMEHWGGRELIAHIKSQFSDYCFFGFSSLGGQPGDQNEIPRVAPHRVLDPLMWLLYKKQVLKTG